MTVIKVTQLQPTRGWHAARLTAKSQNPRIPERSSAPFAPNSARILFSLLCAFRNKRRCCVPEYLNISISQYLNIRMLELLVVGYRATSFEYRISNINQQVTGVTNSQSTMIFKSPALNLMCLPKGRSFCIFSLHRKEGHCTSNGKSDWGLCWK